jgi:hypothetical protein
MVGAEYLSQSRGKHYLEVEVLEAGSVEETMLGVGLSGTNFRSGLFGKDEVSWGVLPIGFTVHRRVAPAAPPRPRMIRPAPPRLT